MSEPLLHYESRLSQLQTGIAQARLDSSISAALWTIATAILVVVVVYAVRQQLSFAWTLLPAPFVFATVRRYRSHQQTQSRCWRLQLFYTRAVQRLRGDWSESPSGEEFIDPAHLWTSDLNVFGEASLFQLLCTVRTAIGRQGLALYLSTTPSAGVMNLRREAIQELAGNTGIRERIALLGKFDFRESKPESFHQWLKSPALEYAKPLQIAARITSFILIVLIVTAITGLMSWINLAFAAAPILAFHVIAGRVFRDRIKQMLATLHAASVETQVFREGLTLLETSQFESKRLVHLNRAVCGASTAVRKLERLFNALNERNKEWFYGPSLLILFATQMCMALEDWRRLHGSQLPVWLDAWAEFEALNSLANYAWENPANRYPAINSSATLFEAKALGHPLIPAANCVCNEVRLNAETRFFIISGSNMSGKSTLMRAIGLNTVLALAGAPVRAESLTLSPLHICASLSVVDSLQNGTSKFLAEMERLRLTLTTASCSPVLFLIDEIFSGTNSPDRRTASEAVVRTLITRGAIGALSTHDLTLTEIAEVPELFGANVHMGSREGGGPMDFDYLLKPGITKETNALAIARMAGVPV